MSKIMDIQFDNENNFLHAMMQLRNAHEVNAHPDWNDGDNRRMSTIMWKPR